MTKPTKARKATKAPKAAKTAGKPSAGTGVKSAALPGDRPPENRILVKAEGEVWVATGTGYILKVEDAALAGRLKAAHGTAPAVGARADSNPDREVIPGQRGSTTGHDGGGGN